MRGFPFAFHTAFDDGREVHCAEDLSDTDTAAWTALCTELAHTGVWVTDRGLWFLSSQHDQETVDITLERLGHALEP